MWLVRDLMLFLAGALSCLVVVHFFLKNYMRMVREMKLTHKAQFQGMISRVYHKDQIPRAKRIRGLSNLGYPATLKLLDLQVQLLNVLIRLIAQFDLLKRPGHHGWANLALPDLEDGITRLRTIIKQTEELKEFWHLTQQESFAHEQNVINTVKEFEQYQ